MRGFYVRGHIVSDAGLEIYDLPEPKMSSVDLGTVTPASSISGARVNRAVRMSIPMYGMV